MLCTFDRRRAWHRRIGRWRWRGKVVHHLGSVAVADVVKDVLVDAYNTQVFGASKDG